MRLWSWPALRALVYLKRIARAQERQATALEQISQGSSVPQKRTPKLAEVFTPSTEEMNRNYREQHAFEEESWR